MPYQWNFYALNKIIDVNNVIIERVEEDVVHSAVQIHSDEIQYTKTNEDTDSLKEYILVNLYCDKLNVVIISHTGCETPTIMACNFTIQEAEMRFIECLKDETGAIIWPLYFDTVAMINVIDSVIEADHWYDTKVAFTIEGSVSRAPEEQEQVDESDESEEEEDDKRRLRRFSIELDRFTCERLSRINENVPMEPFKKSIFPYLYQETGMIINKLPVRYIMLQMLMTIRPRYIVTVQRRMPNNIMIAYLNYIQ